jgi:serine protease Do
MIKRFVIAIGLVAALQMVGRSQQAPAPPPVSAAPNIAAVRPPWAVTVIHRIDLQKLITRLEKEQNVRVGRIGLVAENPVNITTGLLIDGSGHVVTRLGNLDPADKDQDISVVTSDGAMRSATLIGVDGASGFAVLEVESLKGLTAPSATSTPVTGSTVQILSTDVHPERGKVGGQILILPSFRVDSVKVAQGTFYSDARGVVTLTSVDLGPRSDSGIITTADFKVIGVAQAGSLAAGNAYLFPLDFLEGSIIKRVLEKNESVPAGWLGVSGVAAAQLPESERTPLGSGTGVVVKDIAPHSAAEIAGIHFDDVIVGLDGFNIAGVAEMSAVLSACPAGEKIHVREIRQGSPLEIDVVLGARGLQPTAVEVLASSGLSAAGDGRGSPANQLPDSIGYSLEEAIPAGFSARDLTKQLARHFGAEAGTMVTSVTRGSQADRAGLLVGDVIVGSQQESPLTARQLKSLLAASNGPISLKVVRKKALLSVAIHTENAAPAH